MRAKSASNNTVQQRAISADQYLAYSLDMLVVLKGIGLQFEYVELADTLDSAIQKFKAETFRREKQNSLICVGGGH